MSTMLKVLTLPVEAARAESVGLPVDGASPSALASSTAGCVEPLKGGGALGGELKVGQRAEVGRETMPSSCLAVLADGRGTRPRSARRVIKSRRSVRGVFALMGEPKVSCATLFVLPSSSPSETPSVGETGLLSLERQALILHLVAHDWRAVVRCS